MSDANDAGRAERQETSFLFDLDGTLVDSVYQHVLAWREALEMEGIHADRIFVLEQGRIVESGCHDELIERKGLRYKRPRDGRSWRRRCNVH